MPIPGSISLASRQLPLLNLRDPAGPQRAHRGGPRHHYAEFRTELSSGGLRTFNCGDVMKAYLANLPPRIWMLLTLSAVVIAYPLVMVVLPAIIRAVVPETVRSIWSLL